MSWTDIFPVLSDEQIAEYESCATPEDRELLDEWFGVARVINRREGDELVTTSLFWKSASAEEKDLPPLNRQMMKDAKKLGLVSRFSPWEHYVQPLLDGARALRDLRPDVVFRVYLAADLEFLVEDFVQAGAEVMLMRSSSIRHNPGAMWRFLALEEAGRRITITDSDRAQEVIHDLERTEQAAAAGLGMWRVPYVFNWIKSDSNPGLYRPINACQFGATGGYPMGLLLRAFLWHTLRGTMSAECRIRDTAGALGTVPVHGAKWPSYGFDEWFLLAAMYPRMAMAGVLTFIRLNERALNHWYSLDTEYVTWANPSSEILYVGAADFALRFEEQPLSLNTRLLRKMREGSRGPSSSRRTGSTAAPTRLTLAVARSDESLLWALELPTDIDLVVYNKGHALTEPQVLARIGRLIDLPLPGGLPDSYLCHLEESVHDKEGWTVFSPGDPLKFNPDFLRLLDRRGLWSEVQSLSAGFAHLRETEGHPAAIPNDEEWLDGVLVRTELCSIQTLQMLGWREAAGNSAHEHALCHGLPEGWNVGAHFLELAGLDALAEQAWHSELGQFACGDLFAVKNSRLPAVPAEAVMRMREIARRSQASAAVFERMWLHLFGMPFLTPERGKLAPVEKDPDHACAR